MSPRRIEPFLFAITFVAFGWFNQGGGWNQNARFAEVRAIVESHQLSIDHFFCYRRGPGGKALTRYPVIQGDVTIGGTTSRLCWVGQNGDLTPVNGVEPPEEMDGVAIDELACSGDVSYAHGHFHPNKPPGITFLALPAYFLIYHWERLFHRNPDTWWLLDVNAWLTSAFSVGLISAAGVVVAFRLALQIGGGRVWPAFWAAVAFAFGTLYFPFATLLFDHNVTAACLLGSFYGLFRRPPRACAAGLLAGVAAITNYVAAVPAALLFLYALARPGRRAGAAAWYCAGLLGPFLAICAYNHACYGSPFALSNAFQNPTFIEKGPTLLGMFAVPNPGVALILLFSPFRGLFYGAPVLLPGCWGLWRMRRQFPLEAALFLAISLTFLLVNSSFFGWHAGFSCGPRYLIPAAAFLSVPCVYAFGRCPRFAALLLIPSIAINLLFTATDAESPAGVGSLAMTRDRPMWLYSPLAEYALPLFLHGRAWPLLDLIIDERLADDAAQLRAAGTSPDAQARLLDSLRSQMRRSILAGSDDPLELGAYVGPVSVNPTGVCEGGYFRLFPAGSAQARWNSFNVGEFWFPGSRWSLGLLLVCLAGLAAPLAWEAVLVPGALPSGSAVEAGPAPTAAIEPD